MSDRAAPLSLEIDFKIIPAPEALKRDVECFRIAQYSGEEALAIKVSPNGMPGIVFQHNHGASGLESIITPSAATVAIPTSFVYKAGTEPSVMNYRKGAYTTTQVILKPDALRNLLGINALALTSGLVELNEFSSEDLNARLVEARSDQELITILTSFYNYFLLPGDRIVKRCSSRLDTIMVF